MAVKELVSEGIFKKVNTIYDDRKIIFISHKIADAIKNISKNFIRY